MATFTVDLPAHNVVVENAGPHPSPTLTGGSEALADTDTASKVVLSQGTMGFFVGSDGTQSGGGAVGFGLWNQPAGSVIESIRFVALAYREGGGDVPAGTFSAAYTNQPVVTWPVLMLAYAGDGYNGGYNLSTIPLASYGETQTSEDIRHLINGNDYVIAGIGNPDTGTHGLCPKVFIDFNYPTPAQPVNVHLAYLAIRITYSMATVQPHMRGRQRGDGFTGVPRGIQNRSRQASLRGRGFI